MDQPAGVDPLAEDAARCFQYTSSDEYQRRPAPTMDDRVAGKRPMAVELLMQKLICKHKGLIPDSNVKACQPI